jgi:uncharacterized protein
MTRSEISAVSPSAEARPVDGSERLVLLDALRGFALCGVFVSNVFMWFSGRVFVPKDQVAAAMATAPFLDKAAITVFMVLIFGKFITIFAALFGLGFAVQLDRAEARGAAIAPVYTRRLLVMFGLGLTHLFLLWYGDILSTYALLGFLLLVFRGRSDKTLFGWSMVLIFVVPLAVNVLMDLPRLISSPEVAAALAKEAGARSTAIRSEVLRVLGSGGYLDVLRAHALFYFGDFVRAMGAVAPVIFGRFLLGYIAGRRRLFHDPSAHRSFFRRMFAWGLGAGLVTGSIVMVMSQLFMRKIINPEAMPWLGYVMPIVRQIAELGFASVYVAGFTLLFQRAFWQRLLVVLAPVGRMAVSNYLSQTVISLVIFYGYGFGLVGKLSPAQCMALAVGIFCIQIGLSHLWLARFRFGPVEWLWRSLTYGKAQPMRARVAAAQATAIAPAA